MLYGAGAKRRGGSSYSCCHAQFQLPHQTRTNRVGSRKGWGLFDYHFFFSFSSTSTPLSVMPATGTKSGSSKKTVDHPPVCIQKTV